MKFDHLKKIYPTALLTLAIIISVSLLVISGGITQAVLESRQDQETLELLQGIFPKTAFYYFDTDTEIYTLYNSSRSEIGHAFYGEGIGFNPRMVIIIGLEDKETIKDIIVTSQRETRWYWNRLVNSDFFDQFKELRIEDCVLKRYNNDGKVDGITGATISCMGVVNIVRKAALEKMELLN
ncbi:MAG TPA: FMN-binding protein [Dehalococcoidia bacterium]|nr:FMN-binding protein [Dehalococcoidia bacterium]